MGKRTKSIDIPYNKVCELSYAQYFNNNQNLKYGKCLFRLYKVYIKQTLLTCHTIYSQLVPFGNLPVYYFELNSTISFLFIPPSRNARKFRYTNRYHKINVLLLDEQYTQLIKDALSKTKYRVCLE